MLSEKRLIWLVLLVLAGSMALIVTTRLSSGETNVQQPERTRMEAGCWVWSSSWSVRNREAAHADTRAASGELLGLA